MSSESFKDDCLAWAARDPSGVLSPYKFSRRYALRFSLESCVPFRSLYAMNWLCLCISFFLCNRGPKVTWEVLFRALGKDDVSLKITHCGICYADVVMSKNKYGDSRDHPFDPYTLMMRLIL